MLDSDRLLMEARRGLSLRPIEYETSGSCANTCLWEVLERSNSDVEGGVGAVF